MRTGPWIEEVSQFLTVAMTSRKKLENMEVRSWEPASKREDISLDMCIIAKTDTLIYYFLSSQELG